MPPYLHRLDLRSMVQDLECNVLCMIAHMGENLLILYVLMQHSMWPLPPLPPSALVAGASSLQFRIGWMHQGCSTACLTAYLDYNPPPPPPHLTPTIPTGFPQLPQQ